jgi:hypothetical protein
MTLCRGAAVFGYDCAASRAVVRCPGKGMGAIMSSERIGRGFHRLALFLAGLTILIAVALCCVGGVTTKANPTEPFPTFTDGNELFDACEGFRTQGTLSPDEIMRFRYCEAYIVAVADTLAWVKASLRASMGKSVKYCPPKGAASQQLTSVAVNYLRDYPEKRHLAAAALVANALAKGFPCN